MEIRRITSDVEFSLFNVLKEVVIFFVQCSLGFYLYDYCKIYFRKAITLSKRVFNNNLFSELIYVILTLLYCMIIVYLFHVLSFQTIREHVFYIWRSLFGTDSNIRDFNSFNLFYCQENFYYNNNFQNEMEYSSADEYSQYEENDSNFHTNKSDIDVNTIFNKSVDNFCRGSKILDSGYLENFFLSVIIISDIIPIIIFINRREIVANENREEMQNSYSTAIEHFLSRVSKFLIKLYVFFVFVYFAYLYFHTYANYNQIRMLEIQLLQNANNVHYDNDTGNNNAYLDSDSNENLNVTTDETKSSIWWSILELILEIILNINS